MMRGWAHIILVGASIVANARREGVTEYTIPELEEALAARRISRGQLKSKLLRFIEGNPKAASAELNTCLDLLVDGYGRGRQQWAYLVSSDTEVGRLCAETLRDYLEEFSTQKLEGRLAPQKPVEAMGLGSPERFGDGLANLYEIIVTLTRRHREQGDAVFVHATGGFKPETAIAVLAANSPSTGAPIFYVHEHFKEVVRIPAMPVKFREWERFGRLMNHLLTVGAIKRTALEKMFDRELIEHSLRLGWLDEKDQDIRLTPMGRTLWKRIQRTSL